MKLKKREKRMAIILLTLVALPRLASPTKQFLWGNTEQIERQIHGAEDTVARYQDKLVQAQQAQLVVDELLPQCLPQDESRAFSIYQRWLYEVASQTGLSDTLVAPDPVEQSGTGLTLVRARVRGMGSLSAVAGLLKSVQENAPLQRLLECRITPNNKTSKLMFEVSLVVEMLASSQSLLQNIPIPANDEETLSSAEMDNITQLTSMFRPYVAPAPRKPTKVVAKPPARKPKPPPRPKRPPVTLVGTILRGDRAEAIFYNRKSKRSFYLTKGKELQFADGFRAEVLDITKTSVTLKMKRAKTASIVELKLAQNVTDLD